MADDLRPKVQAEALAACARLVTLDAEDRRRELDRLREEDLALHQQVAALLEADAGAEAASFLGADAAVLGAAAGDTVGRYRLIRQLGAGGMGEVWLAESERFGQAQRVALKMLHDHLAQSAAGERFVREGRILAQLSHPHIAALLDAGIAADGRPYLALEYVDGAQIDDWCRDRRLNLAQRVELVLQVCGAVAHAHRHLVVHRDLKPPNILVGGEGQVKLLDFGIAKLIDTDGDAVPTVLTRHGGRVLTPHYASPEQIAGGEVTTATDVHALGVLLYELLSGGRPYGRTATTVAQIELEVLESDAPPMAASLGERAVAGRLAAERATTPRRLRRDLRGDLERIVLKAMSKVPAARYASVEAMADDLRRHLAHQPVEARPLTAGYRLGRFARRHRVGVAAGAVALAVAAVGLAGVLWQAREARAQAELARREARQATAVKDFVVGLFEANRLNHPDGAKARAATAEELLATGSDVVLESLEAEPEVRAEMLATLGELNLLLEKYDTTEKIHRERLRLLRERFGPEDRRLAPALVDWGVFLRQRGKYSAALAQVERAAWLLDQAGEGFTELRGRAEAQLGQITYMMNPRAPEAVEHYRAALVILERFPDSQQLLNAQLGLARTEEGVGDLAAAAADNIKGIALAERLKGPRDTAVAGGHQQLARVLMARGRFAEAEQHIAQAIEIFTFAAGASSGFTSGARRDLAGLMSQRSRYREAAEIQADVVATSEPIDGSDNSWVLSSRGSLARARYGLGDWNGAEEDLVREPDVLATTKADGLRSRVRWLRAALAADRGNFAAALEENETHRQLATKLRGADSVLVGLAHLQRGEIRMAAGQMTEARGAFEEALPLLERDEVEPRVGLLQARIDLAALRAAAGEPEGAAELATLARGIEELTARADVWELEWLVLRELGRALESAGDRASACEAFAGAAAARQPHVVVFDPRLADTRARQAACLEGFGRRQQAEALRRSGAVRPTGVIGPQWLGLADR